jgi:hypothetical protein
MKSLLDSNPPQISGALSRGEALVGVALWSAGVMAFGVITGRLFQKSLEAALVRADAIHELVGFVTGHDHVVVIFTCPEPGPVVRTLRQFVDDDLELSDMMQIATLTEGDAKWQTQHPIRSDLPFERFLSEEAQRQRAEVLAEFVAQQEAAKARLNALEREAGLPPTP